MQMRGQPGKNVNLSARCINQHTDARRAALRE